MAYTENPIMLWWNRLFRSNPAEYLEPDYWICQYFIRPDAVNRNHRDYHGRLTVRDEDLPEATEAAAIAYAVEHIKNNETVVGETFVTARRPSRNQVKLSKDTL